jgi:hypothetical protein
MSRWTSDESDSDSWQSHNDHYDNAFDAGLPLRNGLLVKTWDGVFRREKDDLLINPSHNVVNKTLLATLEPEDPLEPAEVGIIVESNLVGRPGGMQYWQYLVNWPNGIVWEDPSDLVMEHDWEKTYYEWLQETAPESF